MHYTTEYLNGVSRAALDYRTQDINGTAPTNPFVEGSDEYRGWHAEWSHLSTLDGRKRGTADYTRCKPYPENPFPVGSQQHEDWQNEWDKCSDLDRAFDYGW